MKAAGPMFTLLLQMMLPVSAVAAPMAEIRLPKMIVSEGAGDVRVLASGLIEITGPRFRAVEVATRSNPLQLVFSYRGEAENGSPLEGGEFRIQIGQKLLAADPCNLVYVMWRIYPVEQIVVSVKRYPGSTSAQCGNSGYTNIAGVAVPASYSARSGVKRTLRSDYDPGTQLLRVLIGSQQIWQGYLPDALVRDLRGPSGLRSDNGEFRFRLFGVNTLR